MPLKHEKGQKVIKILLLSEWPWKRRTFVIPIRVPGGMWSIVWVACTPRVKTVVVFRVKNTVHLSVRFNGLFIVSMYVDFKAK